MEHILAKLLVTPDIPMVPHQLPASNEQLTQYYQLCSFPLSFPPTN